MKYNKNNILKLTLALLFGLVMMAMTSAETYAAPKQMPDGNIFDATYYGTTYPDVAAAYGWEEAVLYNHYALCGSKEGRLPYESGESTPDITHAETPKASVKVMPDGNKFDAVFYATTYPDVAVVLGTDEAILYKHYVLYGSKEGRLPYQLSEQEIRNREIYNKIIALKESYPHGMKWDDYTTYQSSIKGSETTACYGFACMVWDNVFGTSAYLKKHETGLKTWKRNAGAEMITSKETEWTWAVEGYVGQDPIINATFEEYWDKIQVGDGLVDCSHIVIVLTKENDHVTVVEGNYSDQVRWGRKISKEALRRSLNYIETPSW